MEQRIGIERMEEAVNLFGSFDENIRLLEAEFQVQAVNRGGEIVVSGEPENVMLAVKAVQALLTLSNKGETITDQHVRYVIGLVRSGQAERISELTQDVICITSKGRPVKPKTIGQKEYVNAILKQTVTIGVGPAGTGKTMGAKAIAAGLGLPYMKYTCSAGTEIYDFVGMVFPNTEHSTGNAQLDQEREQLQAMGGINYANVSNLLHLPGLDDMDYDPAGAYFALTGEENQNATAQECMELVLEKVTEKVRQLSVSVEGETSSQTYTYVETDFIKALKNGYLVEIQEPSTVLQPGVLVGLNSLLEQGGTITLPTGEVIHRHPDAVVVVTTNVSYEGCRTLNQSVVDRMSLVKDIQLPTPEVMAQRVMAVTGAEDEYQVCQMVQVVNDLADYCRKNGITDGTVGMRSLLDWVTSAEISGNPYTSALDTIISKATADEEDREALITSILDPVFAPKRRKIA